jgi:hypothetical protein
VLFNKTPYFITPPNSWHKRPGPLPPIGEPEAGYRLRLRRLALIGSYTQTFTGLTTMEAANESARHGVNAILDDAERNAHPGTGAANRFTRCRIWPLEQDEPGDLNAWKYMDERLYSKGKPHLIEGIGLDKLLSLIPRGFKLPQTPRASDPVLARLLQTLNEKLVAFEKFDPF